MLTPEELNTIQIHQWDEGLNDHFANSDILLGNGFSINLCARLNYSKLFEIFSTHCSEEIIKIFNEIDTSNFEYVMNALALTHKISKILGAGIPNANSIITQIKTGLIESIKETHPSWAETNFPLIRSLAVEFQQFNHIYTTNYDIFLYRIILANNELLKLQQIKGLEFGDDFYDEIDSRKVAFDMPFREDVRRIYYLHGALFLFREGGITYKLRKIDDRVEFIQLIKEEMDFNNFPVFVAEGSSRDKEDAINSNAYLTFCLSRLKDKRTEENQKLVSYGFSFGESDKHIVNTIKKSGVKDLAVSLWPSATLKQLQAEKNRINSYFPKLDVTFYDSRSLFTFDEIKYPF